MSGCVDLFQLVSGFFWNIRIVQGYVIETDDGIHRGTDLMAHIGQECCLGFIGFLRCIQSFL